MISPKICRQFASGASQGRGCNPLFSLPSLTEPSSFLKLSKEAVEAVTSMQDQVVSETQNPGFDPRKSLMRLDAISNKICEVIDVSELTRSVHADPMWRSAAEEAFSHLSTAITHLNTSVPLYEAVCRVEDAGKGGFSSEERRMVRSLRVEMEREGIHLSDSGRSDVVARKDRIVALETEFQTNINNARSYYMLPEECTDAMTRLFGSGLLGQVRDLVKTTDPGVALTTDSFFTLPILQQSPDAFSREVAYMASNTLVPQNLSILDGLVKERNELARMLGFDSWAHKELLQNMSGTPAMVKQFLESLHSQSKGEFKVEMEALEDAKKRDGGIGKLQPWDISYYSLMLKKSATADSIAQHLPLDGCLSGLQILTDSLFGIEMKEVGLDDKELWCERGVGVRKYVFEREGGHVGTIYFDLTPREGKYSHSAHFTVRCGCKYFDGNEVKDQTPIVALVCNLAGTGGSNLSFGELQTLFHEFGHALHSLLSRTTFQHLSGTRGPVDFVEVPSHLFESLSDSHEVLSLFSSVSPETVSDAVQARNNFPGIENTTQLMYATYDQVLHTGGNLGIGQLHEEFGLPFAEGTHFTSTFGHFNTYGGKYYSYLWAQRIAAQIREKVDADGVVSREAGKRIERILSPGGGDDPIMCVEAGLGEKWSP